MRLNWHIEGTHLRLVAVDDIGVETIHDVPRGADVLIALTNAIEGRTGPKVPLSAGEFLQFEESRAGCVISLRRDINLFGMNRFKSPIDACEFILGGYDALLDASEKSRNVVPTPAGHGVESID